MNCSLRLLDLWDRENNVREGDRRPNLIQTITIPFLIIGLTITFIIDLIRLPCQLRN
jgi:hypothetical protein